MQETVLIRIAKILKHHSRNKLSGLEPSLCKHPPRRSRLPDFFVEVNILS